MQSGMKLFELAGAVHVDVGFDHVSSESSILLSGVSSDIAQIFLSLLAGLNAC